MTRFMDLVFQHMADTAARLEDYPEQFEPLFGLREVDGHELTIVEEWCFGYMRGVSLSDWSDLPDTLNRRWKRLPYTARKKTLRCWIK